LYFSYINLTQNIPDKKLIQEKNKNNFLDSLKLVNYGRAHPLEACELWAGPPKKKIKKFNSRLWLKLTT